MKLIDIHFHVVPGVDDGSQSMEESLEMLRMAVRQGAAAVAATPHSFAFDAFGDAEIRTRFSRLQEAVLAAGIPVALRLGCEVNCGRRRMREILSYLESGLYPTMNGTAYVLTEFNPWTEQDDACECVDRLLAAGYIPLIAHAERYGFINPATAAELRDRGAFIQINAYSVRQERSSVIRERTHALLEAELADFLGSDTHRLSHRPPNLIIGAEALYETYEKAYIDRLVYQNARDRLFG